MAVQNFTTEELESEEWRPLPKFSLYEASSLGRIRSLKQGRVKLLTQEVNTCGYLRVGLTVNNRQRKHLVHRLVAQTFLGEPADKMPVDHLDGCKANNRTENLQYVTDSENQRRAVKMGLIKSGDQHYSKTHPEKVRRGFKHAGYGPKGVDHHSAKLNDALVVTIRQSVANGRSMLSIAKRLGLHHATIWAVVKRHTWKHVT